MSTSPSRDADRVRDRAAGAAALVAFSLTISVGLALVTHLLLGW